MTHAEFQRRGAALFLAFLLWLMAAAVISHSKGC